MNQGDLLRADGVGLVLGEVVLSCTSFSASVTFSLHALHVAVENLEGGRDGGLVVVAVEQKVAEGVAVLGGEFVDVALQEEEVRRVEREEVILQPALRHLRRDRLLQIMILLQQFADDVRRFRRRDRRGRSIGLTAGKLDRRVVVGCGAAVVRRIGRRGCGIGLAGSRFGCAAGGGQDVAGRRDRAESARRRRARRGDRRGQSSAQPASDRVRNKAAKRSAWRRWRNFESG